MDMLQETGTGIRRVYAYRRVQEKEAAYVRREREKVRQGGAA